MNTFKVEQTVWKLVDSHWVNVERNFTDNDGNVSHTLIDGTLADYLWLAGYDIPDTISYCLARNEQKQTELKFRVFGGHITVFLSPID